MPCSNLLKPGNFEAKNQFELSLIQAFKQLESNLKPPFSLSIPNPQEYLELNRAIFLGILIDTHKAIIYIKYLHAIVTDGYAFFVSLIVKLVNELYDKLVESVKHQLIWVVREIVDVLGVGFDGMLVSLLRQIVGGDFSDGNLWLCYELVSVFLSKFECLLEEEPMVLSSALYVFLRLLGDHCRLSNSLKLDSLKVLEIEFCVKMLREQFCLCMKIGRDLVRLLQDLVHVPVFRAIWKDLLLNPSEFKVPGFSDISQLYCSRTSSRYFLLRITPEIETNMRFMLMHVKFGSQKRHQLWFAKKFLFGPERETLVVDIVRFICCGHHPSNETILSDVIPRWAVIGWLLKSCRKNYVQANVKLALYYDWLFFDERIDNIMNIEPGMLLIVCSIPKYMDMAHSLLEFLLLLMENYDVDRPNVTATGLSSAFNILVQKGVIRSLDVLTSCDALSPSLKERLGRLWSNLKAGVFNKSQPDNLPQYSVSSSLQQRSYLGTPTRYPEQSLASEVEVRCNTEAIDTSITVSDALSNCQSVSTSDSQIDVIEGLLNNLADTIKKSSSSALQILEAILLSFLNLNDQGPVVSISPDILCSRIADQYQSIGYKFFSPLEKSPSVPCSGHEIRSATNLITRTFIFSLHEKMQGMLVFWLRNGFPVGAHLLSYALQLAYEAHVTGCSGNAMADSNLSKLCESGMPLLTFHIDGYSSFSNAGAKHACKDTVPVSEIDKKLVIKLVENAFAAYKYFFEFSIKIQQKEDDMSLSKLLLIDAGSCLHWERVKPNFLFSSIFHHFADLCIGEENIIRLLISRLNHADIVEMQFEIGLKKIVVFGDNSATIFLLMKNSLSWDPLEQHRFWSLIRSELVVSKVQVEKIILQFLCCDDLDANVSAIAVGGLLTLCTCCAPTTELVGAIMLLPDHVFHDFAATALASWVLSNPTMLFDSLAKFSELNNKNGVVFGSTGIKINRSAVLWLVNYFTAQGVNASDILSSFPCNTLGG
ncbi:uncharacterized protein LOC126685907 [Mercurialis annua]|uniref:uncharacterized protein LOC126685907 n=1 Tax=Mercurialis annua TaxID=3986 RepID=UPI00216034E9|nr:uncharacterized protein LOC126685907 [Mercurialis annua]XP_050235860.1 uncharacterized protein LOC126685907 [Mercurialis annua]XP_050235861.1 uncharacterized protein LOC126685907 [Mercurialis annua]XP_050235862.1 uncharacterized protein LOC126685907 [Mercurialis annua]XP_050235866.1 uncharacterized protein LOC126685907 [Mercurialis annua]XP_050235868.1 uncharacterized protein LOC126685907 [Mercurialis annua]XP_050235869.1 uncharacterized protein LOC126685907 [Mercurialis annua]XP_05023587